MKVEAKYSGKPTKTPKMMVTYAEKKKLDNMPKEESTQAEREMISYDPYKNGRNPKGEAAKRQEEYYAQTVAAQNKTVLSDVSKRNSQEKASKVPDAPLIRNSDKSKEQQTQQHLQRAAEIIDEDEKKKKAPTVTASYRKR